VKRGGSLSFLIGTISNVLVMEIGWTDVLSGGYILVSCAHSNTSFRIVTAKKNQSLVFGKYIPWTYFIHYYFGGCHGHDHDHHRMVVGFTTTYIYNQCLSVISTDCINR
jgi:hypothetical protein